MKIREEKTSIKRTATTHYRVEEIWNRVFEYEANNKQVLDIGSGDGRKGAQLYLHKGVDPTNWYALDGQQMLLNILETKDVNTFLIDFYQSRAKDVLPKGKKFDVFLCVEIIEHFANLSEQLDLIEQGIDLLKDGGNMCVSFPEYAVLDGNKFGHKCKHVDTDSIIAKVAGRFENIDIFKISTGPTFTIFINGFGKK